MTTARRRPPDDGRADYVGAVYGSLLAASVVASADADGTPLAALDLAATLLATGLVFWIAHVYARVVGGRATHPVAEGGRLPKGRVSSVARRELPIAQAAIPPTVVAVLGWALGVSDAAVASVALGVAIAGQVGWAVLASVRAGMGRRGVVVSGFANLAMGLAIVLIESALH